MARTPKQKRTSKRRSAALIGVLSAAAVATAALAPVAAASDEPRPLVIGGHDATEEYPFMASLQVAGSHNCGASLIRPDWLVTAAHCVASGTDPASLNVRVGSNDRTTGGSEARVTQIIVHPDYAPPAPGGDIALLKLDHPVPQQPIQLADGSGAPGTATRILGWGLTCDRQDNCSDLPITLQELDTKLVDDGQCAEIDGPRELCTDSDTPDAQACNGDSGGPQLIGRPGDWRLIGATSRDGDQDPRCSTGTGIWTDATSYADWIQQNVGS
ncbi:serine protease [Saccharopolyspora sp. K220]|uniref:S1 family peptidase n=1 Tax=Saccharopolyspora soli TaxID=2926618 RepID=UPI001F568950|nr:serine protease [Saccharopolyspora soli]MCI2424173.1 serine protease [Saccharopolyspora soli]